eukprot:scaffold15470_cov59-Phaeocystis_antarctica.AAC.3
MTRSTKRRWRSSDARLERGASTRRSEVLGRGWRTSHGAFRRSLARASCRADVGRAHGRRTDWCTAAVHEPSSEAELPVL